MKERLLACTVVDFLNYPEREMGPFCEAEVPGQVHPCAICFKVMIRLQVGREAGKKRKEGEKEQKNSPEELKGAQFPEKLRKGILLFVFSAS